MSYNPPFPSPGHQQGFPAGPGYPGATYPAQPVHGGGAYPPSPGMPQGAPMQGGGGVRNIDTNVAADGCTFNIAHRDSNSLLSCRLPPGYELKAKPGSMVAMDATIKIRGKVRSPRPRPARR